MPRGRVETRSKEAIKAKNAANYARHGKVRCEREKAWRLANPELARDKQRKHYLGRTEEQKRRYQAKRNEIRNKNREHENVLATQYYWNKREEVLEKKRIKRMENPDQVRAAERARYAKNKDRDRQYHCRKVRSRTARQLLAPGHHTVEQWMARVEVNEWKCFYCEKQLDERTLTKDHAIALRHGGSEWPSNLVPACKSCNSAKNDKSFKQFIEYRKSGIRLSRRDR